MAQKPANWYSMSYDEQRAWERQERERSDLEYERDQAREENERQARRTREARDYARTEIAWRDQERSELYERLAECEAEERLLRRFIEERGLTTLYQMWHDEMCDDSEETVDLKELPDGGLDASDLR